MLKRKYNKKRSKYFFGTLGFSLGKQISIVLSVNIKPRVVFSDFILSYVLRTNLYSEEIANAKADFDQNIEIELSIFRQNTIMAHGMVETEVNMVSYTNDDTTIMYVLIIGALLLTFLVVLGLLRLCCHKTDFIRTAYPVAISNRMFNVSVVSVRRIFFLLLNGTHIQCPISKQSLFCSCLWKCQTRFCFYKMG